MIKLIHTSDVHLGARSLGIKSNDALDVIKRTFKKICEFCVEKKIDFLIIAGDLFDSNEPPQSIVEFVKDRLKYLDDKNIKVVISPGNHDNLGKNSIYLRENFSKGLNNIFIFNSSENFVINFPEYDLAIVSKPCFFYESSENLFKSISKTDEKYNVAIIHGSSSKVKGEEYKRYFPFEPGDVADSGMDYVALGHWHSFRDESSGGVTAVYSGSPEPISVKQKESGGIVYVEIDNRVKFERISVSEKKFDEISIQLDTVADIAELKEIILKGADKNLVRAVNLVDFVRLNFGILPENLEEELGENFARLKIIDKTHIRISDEDLAGYPKETVIGQFVSLATQKINSAASEEDKNIFEEALRLGVAELEGKKMIKDIIK